MITQSKDFSASCFWFSTLVSKKTHLRLFQPMLKEVKAAEVKTLPMQLGNKSSTILSWTFLSQKDQKQWKQDHWL
jgi:23S rRNA (adenine1618-N6)-methyltransferase